MYFCHKIIKERQIFTISNPFAFYSIADNPSSRLMFTQAVKDHLKNDEYLHVNGTDHHHREKSTANNDRFTPIEDGVQHNEGMHTRYSHPCDIMLQDLVR